MGVHFQPRDVLKLGFWNINGFNSKVIGYKLLTRDFFENIESYNLIGLDETHIRSSILDKLSIPGYTMTQYSNREPHSKGCGSGGIVLFCKQCISKYVTPIPNSNKDVIWVRIDKDLCGRIYI